MNGPRPSPAKSSIGTPEAKRSIGTPELEAELIRTRAELAQTLEALSERIDPKVRMREAQADAQQAAADVVTLVTGGGLPESPARKRRLNVAVSVIIATTATIAVVAVTRAIRARRHTT